MIDWIVDHPLVTILTGLGAYATWGVLVLLRAKQPLSKFECDCLMCRKERADK